MNPLERVSARVHRIGDPNDSNTPRPLLTLEEFFDGNDDDASIGSNLMPVPGPATFYSLLKRIADRADVADVRVQITAFDDPEMWPFSDTIWIATTASPEMVASWFPEALRPDNCWSGWLDGVRYEPYDLPPGMQPVGCWWD